MAKKNPKHVNILGIDVLSTNKAELLASIASKVSHSDKFYIVTPNPELIMMAQSDNDLKSVINNAGFSIPDGIGLAQAAKLMSFKKSNFVVTFCQGLYVGFMTLANSKYVKDHLPIHKGREVFLELLKIADYKHWRVFLLGGEGNEAESAAVYLNSIYPRLLISFAKGPILNKIGKSVTEVDRKLYTDAVSKVNSFSPHLLFVAFGNPKQEFFIQRNLNSLKINCAMTVGGAFRYFAGMSKFPPKWMENIGLEWVFRLYSEPFRIRRIFNAFPIFPLKVFWSKVAGD